MKPLKCYESNESYRSNPAVSRSMLHLISKSPLHYKYASEHTAEQSASLFFGSAFHCFVLEPQRFENEYTIIPYIDKRTSDGKKAWESLKKSEKKLLTEDDFLTIQQMSVRVFSNPYASALLQGEKEMSYYWTDEFTGIRCKCRPDCRTEIDNICVIVDLKTCNNAQNDAFVKDAMHYGYDLQVAQYSQGVELYEKKPHRFVFIAVEKNPPFAINILEADDIFRQKGTDDFRTNLGILKQCRESGNWYGYTREYGKPNLLNPPLWLIKKYR